MIAIWFLNAVRKLVSFCHFYYHLHECITHVLTNTTSFKIMESESHQVLVTYDLLAGCDAMTKKKNSLLHQ
jgi:hypothetical protein